MESQPGEVSAAKRISATVGERAAAIALQQVGSAYRYGGTSPAGFDCSGLVQYSYRAAGKTVPRTTGQLWNVAGEVAYDDLQAGDLLFFRFDGKMSHVGIYVGNEQFVHAPSAGGSRHKGYRSSTPSLPLCCRRYGRRPVLPQNHVPG